MMTNHFNILCQYFHFFTVLIFYDIHSSVLLVFTYAMCEALYNIFIILALYELNYYLLLKKLSLRN